MASPPTSPSWPPSHRRRASSIDTTISNGSRFSRRRRSSAAAHSPVTPRSSHDYVLADDPQSELNDPGMEQGYGGGLGSLADELAEAWDDEEMGEEDGELPDPSMLTNGAETEEHELFGEEGKGHAGIEARDSGIALDSSPTSKTLSPTKSLRQHRRNKSRYDGSDYGDESDLEASEGISAGLERCMAEVEGLARRGLEANGGNLDNVVNRVTEALRDLGSQAGVESGTTRLTTAHTALATHHHHQTRALTSLTSTLFGPMSAAAAPLGPDAIDDLLPLLHRTLELLPHPPPQPIYALSALYAGTNDLLQTLSYLSDSLHMSRQTTAMATRRLRTVTDALAEWRRESELRDEGVRWIERGGWERRLREREAKRVCGEVVSGFEEVCEGWRRRLVEGTGVAA